MENLRGAVLMTLAMLGFAIEDMFIKLIADALPTWQIIAFLGVGGATIFASLTLWKRQPLFSRACLDPTVLGRNLGELIGTIAFVSAVALTPISSASAILQATPLVVTLGAALFLKEPVGWRRWTAILIGFFGVILVIRPGTDAFNALSLFAVVAAFGLGARDLLTRKVPAEMSSLQLSFLGFLTLVPAATLLSLATGQPAVNPTPTVWLLVLGSIVLGVASYYAIVAAMRVGDVSYVAPFRYSRILFALVVGMVVFKERPDATMMLGAAIIVGSGIYTIWREAARKTKTVR